MNEELEIKNEDGAKCGKSDNSALLCAPDEQLEEELNHGLKMVCDRCDHIGSNEHGYPEWQLQEHGGVLCQSCAEDDT